MGDQKHRRHRRHRSTTIGHIVGGIGNSLAVALQHASHAVDYSLKSTDVIVKASLAGPHRNHQPNHSSSQELYPRQQYHHFHQHQQRYQPGGAQNTAGNPPSPLTHSFSTAYYNEPPPAYSEATPAYCSDSPPAYNSDLPPPYTASTLLGSGALSVAASTEQAPAYTSDTSVYGVSTTTVDSVKVPPYDGLVLAVPPKLSNVYVKPAPTRSPLVHGEAVPVYGFPSCYHYKYTDGCKYCLKWKWS